MRAPFDTTCDLVIGPGSPGAGTVYATVPCRFVPYLGVASSIDPLSQGVGYLTMDAVEPNGPLVSSFLDIFTLDYNVADRIGFPHLGPVLYSVLYVEIVNYRSHPQYYRVFVREVGT